MAVINKLDNSASITYGGNTIKSNNVSTLLLLAPTIVKAVDKPAASIGDTLTYTITITNLSLSEIAALPLTDTLPAGSVFQTGSFKVNGASATPTLQGSTLTYAIPSIPAAGVAVVTFQVQATGDAN